MHPSVTAIPPIIGAYEILGLVGRGGMAEVYAVRSRQTGERFALKIAYATLPEIVARFEREVRLQARLTHKNVLPIVETLTIGGRPAMILPFIEGPTLERLLGREICGESALRLFRQLLGGLAAIHEAGLVHRDLKPANILLDPSGGQIVALLADFGVAKALSGEGEITSTGVWVGTPAYAAPEQRKDASRVSARADLWALGTIAIELFAGERPGIDDPVERFAGALPEEIRDLVLWMRRSDPDARPMSAAAASQLLGPGPDTIDDPELITLCGSLVPPILVESAPPSARPSALPAERDLFVGRARELAEIGRRLSEARLLTLLGAAGVGKTRLVLHFAWRHFEQWPGGAWFCDLSEARDIDSACSAVARTLALQLGADPVRQIGHAIAARGRCLLILDNVEQIAQVAAQLLSTWLDRASDACFIATTRERLQVVGESVMTVEPMSREDARALFVQRAEVAQRGFLQTGDSDFISDLVIALDGLPLAVELAAGRARAMTPEQMLARLSDRFRLLVASGRAGRHAALGAALDWSYALLSESERQGFAQLSVFDGGFSLEAAEAVLDVGEAWALDVVQSLIDKSLVRRLSASRLGMLESIKEYAARKLSERGDLERSELRHGQHFASLGSTASLSLLRARGGTARFWRLSEDLPNLMKAARRAIERGDVEVAAGAARACWAIFERRGPPAPGALLLDAVLAMPGLEPGMSAYLRCDAGVAARQRGLSGAARFEEALRLVRDIGAPHTGPSEPQILNNLALESLSSGRSDEARALVEEALSVARAGLLNVAEGSLLNTLGMIERTSRRHTEAEDCYLLAIERARACGDQRGEAAMVSNLGSLLADMGSPEKALSRHEAALGLHRETGDRRAEAIVLGNIGIVHFQEGRLAAAERCYAEALRLHRELGDRQYEGITLVRMGEQALQLARGSEARSLLSSALGVAREASGRIWPELLLCLARLDIEQDLLSAARERATAALAACITQGDRLNESFSLACLGRICALEGRFEEAYALCESAISTAERLRSPAALAQKVLFGRLLRLGGSLERATSVLESARVAAHARRAEIQESLAVEGLACCALMVGDHREAFALALWALPKLRTFGRRIWLAELLCVFAEVQQARGEHLAAQHALEEAEGIALDLGTVERSELGRSLARVRALGISEEPG